MIILKRNYENGFTRIAPLFVACNDDNGDTFIMMTDAPMDYRYLLKLKPQANDDEWIELVEVNEGIYDLLNTFAWTTVS